LVETLRLEAGRVIEVAPGRRLQRNADGRLEAAAAEPEFLLAECDVSLEGQADEIEFAGLKIRWERLAGGLAEWRDLAQAKNCEVFDSESLGRAITLRHWRPGDRYQPIGQVGTTKLQDLFVNQKIPKAKRRQLVVAEAADGRLLWVQQLRIADGGKVTQSTRELLLFNW
jgi:tRNA(Ile)-lysidine synthase